MHKLAQFVSNLHKFAYFSGFHLDRAGLIFSASDDVRHMGFERSGEAGRRASGEAARRTG